MSINGNADDRLRLLIERIERLEEEKKVIADDIKDVYGEAKAVGYDTKTIREIVRLRKMKPDDRREREAMLDLYKAALGMLDGTPLGNWAIERIQKTTKPNPDAAAGTPQPEAEAAPEDSTDPQPTVEEARQSGLEAAREGKLVTANPFPPRDPRRAAWDEAWCQELGTDGMDIPDALKPAAKAKKAPADDAAQPAGAEKATKNAPKKGPKK